MQLGSYEKDELEWEDGHEEIIGKWLSVFTKDNNGIPSPGVEFDINAKAMFRVLSGRESRGEWPVSGPFLTYRALVSDTQGNSFNNLGELNRGDGSYSFLEPLNRYGLYLGCVHFRINREPVSLCGAETEEPGGLPITPFVLCDGHDDAQPCSPEFV